MHNSVILLYYGNDQLENILFKKTIHKSNKISKLPRNKPKKNSTWVDEEN